MCCKTGPLRTKGLHLTCSDYQGALSDYHKKRINYEAEQHRHLSSNKIIKLLFIQHALNF